MDFGGRLSRPSTSASSRTQDRAADIERVRNRTVKRLSDRWDAIYSKYSRDFTHCSDIIDLETGKVIENKGHLLRMTNERDVGTSSARRPRSIEVQRAHDNDHDLSGDELSSPERYRGKDRRRLASSVRDSPHRREGRVNSTPQRRRDETHAYPRHNEPTPIAQPQPPGPINAEALAQLGANIAIQISQILTSHGIGQTPAAAPPPLPSEYRPHSERRPRTHSNRDSRPRHSFPDRISQERFTPRRERSIRRQRQSSREPSPLEWSTSLWEESGSVPHTAYDRSRTLGGSVVHQIASRESSPRDHFEDLDMEAEIDPENSRYGKPFTRAEDEILVTNRMNTDLSWKDIMALVPDRSREGLSNRHKRLLHRFRKRPHTLPASLVDLFKLYPKKNGESTAPTRPDLPIERSAAASIAPHAQNKEVAHAQEEQVVHAHEEQVAYAREEEVAHAQEKQVTQAIEDEEMEDQDLADQDLEDQDSIHQDPTHPFTQSEDDLLWQLRVEDELPFEAIKSHLPGRNWHSIFHRYQTLKRESDAKEDTKAKRKSGQRLEANHADKAPLRIREYQPIRAQAPYKNHKRAMKYDPAEDKKIWQLHYEQKVTWREVALQVPGRDAISIQNRAKHLVRMFRNGDPMTWETAKAKGKDSGVEEDCGNEYEDVDVVDEAQQNADRSTDEDIGSKSQHDSNRIRNRIGPKARMTFTMEEDKLIDDLRNNRGLTWKEIAVHFPHRSMASLQVHYSCYLKDGASGQRASWVPPSRTTRSRPVITIPDSQDDVVSALDSSSRLQLQDSTRSQPNRVSEAVMILPDDPILSSAWQKRPNVEGHLAGTDARKRLYSDVDDTRENSARTYALSPRTDSPVEAVAGRKKVRRSRSTREDSTESYRPSPPRRSGHASPDANVESDDELSELL